MFILWPLKPSSVIIWSSTPMIIQVGRSHTNEHSATHNKFQINKQVFNHVLRFAQVVKQFSAFYGTWNFITEIKTVCVWQTSINDSQIILLNTLLLRFFAIHFNSIFPSMPRSSSGLLTLDFPTNIRYVFSYLQCVLYTLPITFSLIRPC
jgi:hypothetical protein